MEVIGLSFIFIVTSEEKVLKCAEHRSILVVGDWMPLRKAKFLNYLF